MIKDSNGNIHTHDEFKEKKIEEIQVNVNDTKSLTKRLEDLEVALVKTKACKEGHARLEVFYKEIKQYLPEEKHKLIMKLDDLYMELLIVNEEYFYKHGYYDGRNFNGFVSRVKAWLSNKLFRA